LSFSLLLKVLEKLEHLLSSWDEIPSAEDQCPVTNSQWYIKDFNAQSLIPNPPYFFQFLDKYRTVTP